MEFKDYISIAAFFISLVSLGVTAWNVRFGQRAKLAELRASLLMKVAELTSRLSRIRDLQSRMRRHSEEAKDFEIFKIFVADDVGRLQKGADDLYKRIADLPLSRGLDAHVAIFNKIHELNESVQEIERETQKFCDEYLAKTEIA